MKLDRKCLFGGVYDSSLLFHHVRRPLLVEASSQLQLRTQAERRRCRHARASQLLVIEVPRRDVRRPLELSAQGFCGAEMVDSVAEQPIATFKSAWGGQGLLTMAGGETFHLVCKGWWRPVWSVIAENGQTVL